MQYPTSLYYSRHRRFFEAGLQVKVVKTVLVQAECGLNANLQ